MTNMQKKEEIRKWANVFHTAESISVSLKHKSVTTKKRQTKSISRSAFFHSSVCLRASKLNCNCVNMKRSPQC